MADLFPFWAIPLAVICFELARFYGRHRQKGRMAFLFTFSFTLLGLSLAYFIFDGRNALRPAMQNFERSYLQ